MMAAIDKMSWSIEISKGNNGYLLKPTGSIDCEEGKFFVIEDTEDEHETMVNLLRTIQDYFGVYTSKHNKINCRVILEDENYEK